MLHQGLVLISMQISIQQERIQNILKFYKNLEIYRNNPECGIPQMGACTGSDPQERHMHNRGIQVQMENGNDTVIMMIIQIIQIQKI